MNKSDKEYIQNEIRQITRRVEEDLDVKIDSRIASSKIQEFVLIKRDGTQVKTSVEVTSYYYAWTGCGSDYNISWFPNMRHQSACDKVISFYMIILQDLVRQAGLYGYKVERE